MFHLTKKKEAGIVCLEREKNVPHKLRIGPVFNSSDTLDFDETVLNLP
jgi:hypothetical protein